MYLELFLLAGKVVGVSILVLLFLALMPLLIAWIQIDQTYSVPVALAILILVYEKQWPALGVLTLVFWLLLITLMLLNFLSLHGHGDEL